MVYILKLKSIFLLFLLFLLLSIGMISCKKGSSGEDNKIEKVPVANAEMIKIIAGKKRVKLSFLINPDSDISKVAMFWNASADSVVIPINSTNKLDTIHVFVDNLEEKDYDFLVFTYNAKGDRSHANVVREKVYGDLYESKLENRGIVRAILEADGNGVIDWGISETIETELIYKNEDDKSQRIIIPANESQTILRRYKRNSTFEYRTLSKPKASVVDTFYSVTKIGNVVEHGSFLTGTIAERIEENSNLIQTLISSTTNNTYPGLEESYVKFIDQKGKPQSLFVLQIDLNNESLSLETGTPSDGVVYGTNQTVSEMITWKNKNSKEKKVIAAVNGDYFTIATGIPLGPTIKSGVELKSLNSSDYCFIGVLKNNLCVIGQGETVYREYLSRMKETLGAFQLLVSEGVIQNQVDVSRAPRTTAGVIGISKLIFIVVDGRQAGYSDGLSLEEMAIMHKAIGVKNAVNLDGGGSSTFIVKNDQDQYIIKNKVSDGSQRKVANSWLVMKSTH